MLAQAIDENETNLLMTFLTHRIQVDIRRHRLEARRLVDDARQTFHPERAKPVVMTVVPAAEPLPEFFRKHRYDPNPFEQLAPDILVNLPRTIIVYRPRWPESHSAHRAPYGVQAVCCHWVEATWDPEQNVKVIGGSYLPLQLHFRG